MMYTINQLIKIIEAKHSSIDNNRKKEILTSIKQELVSIKGAPELKGSCNIDFKLSNTDEYFDRINKV